MAVKINAHCKKISVNEIKKTLQVAVVIRKLNIQVFISDCIIGNPLGMTATM